VAEGPGFEPGLTEPESAIARSLRGRKSDQCHSREGLFLVSQFHWHLPFRNDGIRSVKVRTVCRRLARANGRASLVRQSWQKKIFFMGATCAGHVTEKTLTASCKI
jgi:hypothetical protein